MKDVSWRDDLAGRFVARANPALERASSPQLAELADEVLYDATGEDVDLPDLVRFAISFVDSLDSSEDAREGRALRAAGGAFLLATARPSPEDIDLIAKGNGRKFDGDTTSKVARDTWAYMAYKRAMRDDRRAFYTFKPGLDMRAKFCEAVLDAVAAASEDAESFRQNVKNLRRIERTKFGVHYEYPQPGLASSASRIDRAEFLRDVTIPDGTMIPIGAHFTKTWEIRNSGQVPWVNRRLTRMTPQGATLPWSEDSIPIPDTWPGQVVQLSIDFVAARVQGSSEIRFKMTDRDGKLCFPTKYAHGLTVMIETSPLVWINREPPL